MLLAGLFLSILSLQAWGLAPNNSVVVFTRGEGGYFCHKIPYMLRTLAGTLLALAEGRGKNGRSACDDFSVSPQH